MIRGTSTIHVIGDTHRIEEGIIVSKEQINPKYKDDILKALEYHFPGAKVILFGSRARGTHKEGADVDIAIDAGEKIILREMGRARLTLENLFMPLSVDLVDLNNISDRLKQEIIQDGVVWKN